MLEIARAKPGADRVQWMEGTLAAPALPPPPLDAVGCFYDTLNHLPDVAALAASVRGIAAGLRPGGLFVFDATNELGFDRWWRGNRAWHGRGWRVSIETAYDAGARLAHAEVTIEDRARQTRTSLTERYFTDGEIQAALAAAGIDELLHQPWSPFDNDAPGKTWWIGRNGPR
jgi:SAM-dependent methyltransferase